MRSHAHSLKTSQAGASFLLRPQSHGLCSAGSAHVSAKQWPCPPQHSRQSPQQSDCHRCQAQMLAWLLLVSELQTVDCVFQGGKMFLSLLSHTPNQSVSSQVSCFVLWAHADGLEKDLTNCGRQTPLSKLLPPHRWARPRYHRKPEPETCPEPAWTEREVAWI